MSGISFLVPAGLFALFSLPLVYLFHMRSPTPKSARVPSLRFWQVAAPKPTEEPRFRRPPLSLELLLHLAIAALLAFALARPVTSAFAESLGSSGDPVHQIILLDGSTSMESEGDIGGRSRFDQAKDETRARIASLRAGDAVTVVLMGTRIATRSASDPAAVDQLHDDIADWSAPGGETDLTAALLLAGDLRVPGIENRLLLLSDGALAADPSAVEALGMAIEDVRFGPAAAANVAILDLVRRNDPNRPAAGQLLVSIGNFSANPTTTTVSLTVDDVPVTSRDLSLTGEERRTELFSLPSNAGHAVVRLLPGDSQLLDDVASIQLDGGGYSAQNVLIFSDQPDPLFRAFSALPGSQVTVETTNAARDGMGSAGFDLVVYDGVVPASAPVSPAIFVAPPDSEWIRSPAMLVDATIATIDPGDPLLNGVDLTGVVFGPTARYELPEGFVTPVSAADGPLVAYGTLVEPGIPVALLAMPLDQGNFTERIAFPILIANLTAQLSPAPPATIVEAGQPLVIEPAAATASVTLVDPFGEQTTLAAPDAGAGDRSVSFDGTGQPGIYVINEEDDQGVLLSSQRISVNAGNSAESDLRSRPGLDETLAGSASSGEGLTVGERQTELWPLLIAIAALLAALDWLNSIRIARRTPVRTARAMQ